jgi:hypothetical protein
MAEDILLRFMNLSLTTYMNNQPTNSMEQSPWEANGY